MRPFLKKEQTIYTLFPILTTGFTHELLFLIIKTTMVKIGKFNHEMCLIRI